MSSSGRSWTQTEDDLLRRLYASGGTTATIPWGDVALETDRTVGALRGRAKRLRLVATGRSASPPWSPEEDAKLISFYEAGHTTSSIPWDDLSIELGRTVTALRIRTCRIGLVETGRTNRPWSDEDDAYLINMVATHTAPDLFPYREVAEHLGRTGDAIEVRLQRLRLFVGRRRRFEQRHCRVCGTPISRKTLRVETCSMVCSWVIRRANGYEHPRGMAGKHHSETTKLRLRVTSTAAWEAQPEERKAERIARMHAGTTIAIRNGRGPSRGGYSRGKVGKRADLGDRYFRSSWEANYARWLNYQTDQGKVAGWEYEPVTFELGDTEKFYIPDFLVLYPDDRYEWHEVKGWMTAKGQAKIDGFREYHPDEWGRFVLLDAPVYRAIERTARDLIATWERP